MTSNESIDFCVFLHTQYKRVKKIQRGAFMKEIFSVNSGASSKKILCGKKKKQSMSWTAKKAGKRVQYKSLVTETRSAEKGEEEGTWCCFFFPLVLLLLFQTLN